MSQAKQKKTFLKKGTRQFLSNAMVRSLNQKPKIVDFSDENVQTQNTPFVNPHTKNNSKDDIMISVKPKNGSKQKLQSTSVSVKNNTKRNNNIVQNNKNNSQTVNFQENIKVANKAVSNSHAPNNHAPINPPSNSSGSKSIQKKPTLLTDYLSNDSKSVQKKPVPQLQGTKYGDFSTGQSQAQQLKMQNLDDDSQDDKLPNVNQDEDEDNQFIVKNNKKAKSIYQNKKPARQSQVQTKNNQQQFGKKKPHLLNEAVVKRQKQNVNKQPVVQEQHQENQVKFQSDSQDDQGTKKSHFKTKNHQSNKNHHNNRFQPDVNSNYDENDSQDQEKINRKATVKMANKPHSKVTQMFSKNSDKKNAAQIVDQNEQKSKNVTKKMGVDDVPKQLIQQIVQKYFKQAKGKYQKKQQNLFQQVKIVEKKQESLNEQQKILQKRVKQFQKQMQQKNKQFQNKLKSQQNKISRQKMYLKDQQTTGKVDWKTKNQVQELKQQLQEEKNQKKRIQVKLKAQLDRLKARYNEEMESKRIIENRIREYELKDLKSKEIKNKEQKQIKMQTLNKKKTFWDEAPKQSYLQRFYAKEFSLIELMMEDYFYEHNEYFQFYKQKGEADVLQAQQVQGNKIKRTYENGKVQIQSIQKFVKQVFPWGFTIVHYINGDIKQVIELPNRQDANNPKRLEIYYAKNNQIIEYTICNEKRIHYFLAEDQIQLNDDLIELKQVYNGKQIQRNSRGNSVILQRNVKGKFVQIY